ncbi:hypothetical protein ACLB2K_066062 [Fragaria x ananassa]
MSSHIDDVTASFTASLTFAGNEVLDVSRRSGSVRSRNSQAYFLAKPFAPKRIDPSDMHQTFRRVWNINGKFKEYDELVDFNAIKMDSLFFWVRLENIPPRLETKETIEDAAIVAGEDPQEIDTNGMLLTDGKEPEELALVSGNSKARAQFMSLPIQVVVTTITADSEMQETLVDALLQLESNPEKNDVGMKTTTVVKPQLLEGENRTV